MFRASGSIKSLKPFSKVCSNSRHSSLNSIKTLALFQNLSTTATERSDFGNPNGFDGDNLLEYEEKARGSHSPANYNNSNLELKLNSSGQQFRDQLQNPDGNQVGVNQNPARIYGQYDKIEFSQKQFGQSGNNFRYLESPINEIRHIPVGKEGSYSSGYNRGSTRAEFQQNPLGENWKFSNGYTSESPRNEVQQNPSAKNGNFNGNYGQNAGELWQNPTRFNKESFKDSMKIVDGVFGGNVNAHGIRREGAGAVQQNPNGLYGPGSAEANASYGQYTMQSQRSSSNDKMGNMKNIGTSQHSSYNSDTGSTEHVAGNYYGGNTGKYQQSPSDYYGAMTGNPNGYSGETPNGYPGGTNGQYVQNPIVEFRNNAGPQQIPNVYQNGMGVLQDTSNSTAEGADDNRLIGSVEKFDDYCKEGKLKKAVEVLGLLEHKHINIDTPRYVMLMKLCGEAKALEEAKNIYDLLMRSVSHIDVRTYNKILEMYCNCGSLDDSYVVFEKMPQRNLTTWDTMIVWLAKNGRAEESINLFTRFKESGLKPDGQMFISVFSACSFLGDVTEGMLHFESMSKTYGIVPSMEHYVSIVDMMGSTGYLDEALDFIEKMPVDPSIEIWETLMNLCRVHGNTELGDRCAGLVELLDPSRLHEQSKAGLIPVQASDIAKEKEKKLDLLQVRSRVHEYRAGDTSHPDNDKIYSLLRGMRQQMKEAGYIPETKFVLHDVDQESKEDALLAHSERLAVAQGLMSSPARSSMRIIKNLRVCGDCHNALKIISKLVGRELIIRDAKRFHHFKDGLCSCRDYW